MKKILLLSALAGAACVFGGTAVLAAVSDREQENEKIDDTPQHVVSIVKEEHSPEWYRRQAELWQAEIDKDPSNEDAWWYLYQATRYIQWTADDEEPQQLADIVERAGKAIPDTYSYYRLRYFQSNQSGGFDPDEALDGMYKAISMRPDNIEAYNDYAVCLMVKDDDELLEDIMKRWYESGTYSASMLNYSYNALSGMDSNAVYFVDGDSPTFSTLMVQYGKGLFKSVKTVCISLLTHPGYRDAVCRNLDIEPYAMFEPTDTTGQEDYDRWVNQVMLYIIKTSGRTGYFSTVMNPVLEFSDELYSEGLVYKYSEKRYNNLEVKRRNYEERYLTDYLKVSFVPETYRPSAYNLNLNYIPSFKSLLDWYKENNKARYKELYSTMMLIVAHAENIDEEKRQEYYDEIKR